MRNLKRIASPENKSNYDHFQLDPTDRTLFHLHNRRKKSYVNPRDPFFTKYSAPYTIQHNKLFETEQILRIIKPLDHSELKNHSKNQIDTVKRGLVTKYLDREVAYNSDEKKPNLKDMADR